MPDKVLFEFRVKETEHGVGFEVGHVDRCFTVFAPGSLSGCRVGAFAGATHSRRHQWPHRKTDESRRSMRETLDFLEQLYGDLFGEDESTGIEDQQ